MDEVIKVVQEINAACGEPGRPKYDALRKNYPARIKEIYDVYLAETSKHLEYPVLLWNGKCIHAFILQEHEEHESVHSITASTSGGLPGIGMGKHSSSSKGM